MVGELEVSKVLHVRCRVVSTNGGALLLITLSMCRLLGSGAHGVVRIAQNVRTLDCALPPEPQPS